MMTKEKFIPPEGETTLYDDVNRPGADETGRFRRFDADAQAVYTVDDDGQSPMSTEALQRIARRKAKNLQKKQRQQQRRLRRRRRLRVFAAVCGVFFLWLILRLAPVPFGAVIVDGNETMSFAEVYRAAGVGEPVNTVKLSVSDMAARLRKDLRVGDVKITRECPAVIHIDMKERQAAAVLTTMYGFAAVDATGTVIAVEPQIKGFSAPLMTGKKIDTLLLGDVIGEPEIVNAIQYLQALSPEVTEEIVEINVGNPADIIAYTKDSVSIHLGTGDNPVERAALTMELLQEVTDNKLSVQYINADPAAPLVKTK